jgi:predicted transposase YdaD
MRKYDTGRLDELGERRSRLREELKEVGRLIEVEAPKAHKAGVIQSEIARRLRMTRESVAQLVHPDGPRWKQAKRATPEAATPETK